VTESWLHLTVRAKPRNLDAVANFLIERGAPGVVVKAQGLEAYFRRGAGDAVLKTKIARFVRQVDGLSRRGAQGRLAWRRIKRENWHDAWRRRIKARRVGKCFWVKPPWLTAPKSRSRQVITIEPGLAFGTGTHATTRGCMEFIEQAAAALGERRFTALDVGTGSGILAIALVKLGARRVWAIDNDPVALKVARDNLKANTVIKKVRLSAESLGEIRRRFELVVANLTAETVAELASALSKKVAVHGFLILSGIVRRKAGGLIGRFRARFRLVRQKRGREWVTLLLQKK
jgi:ribosomal protein L11 methyltransferase